MTNKNNNLNDDVNMSKHNNRHRKHNNNKKDFSNNTNRIDDIFLVQTLDGSHHKVLLWRKCDDEGL